MQTRLVATGHVVHQRPGFPGKLFGKAFTRVLQSDQQPYERELTVVPEWQPLDVGWITDCSMLMLENRGKELVEVCVRARKTMLTPLEPDLLLPPDEYIRVTPADASRWHLRSTAGPVPCVLMLTPR
jgi:hypothetical protein